MLLFEQLKNKHLTVASCWCSLSLHNFIRVFICVAHGGTNEDNHSELVFLPWRCHRMLFLNISCISGIGFVSVKHELSRMDYSLENGRLFITGTAVNTY